MRALLSAISWCFKWIARVMLILLGGLSLLAFIESSIEALRIGPNYSTLLGLLVAGLSLEGTAFGLWWGIDLTSRLIKMERLSVPARWQRGAAAHLLLLSGRGVVAFGLFLSVVMLYFQATARSRDVTESMVELHTFLALLALSSLWYGVEHLAVALRSVSALTPREKFAGTPRVSQGRLRRSGEAASTVAIVTLGLVMVVRYAGVAGELLQAPRDARMDVAIGLVGLLILAVLGFVCILLGVELRLLRPPRSGVALRALQRARRVFAPNRWMLTTGRFLRAQRDVLAVAVFRLRYGFWTSRIGWLLSEDDLGGTSEHWQARRLDGLRKLFGSGIEVAQFDRYGVLKTRYLLSDQALSRLANHQSVDLEQRGLWYFDGVAYAHCRATSVSGIAWESLAASSIEQIGDRQAAGSNAVREAKTDCLYAVLGIAFDRDARPLDEFARERMVTIFG